MATIYYGDDADLARLEGRRIAVLGYGSQGHAHALNLKDSGCDVVVGLYEGSSSWPRAEADGLTVMRVEEAVRESQIVMVVVPAAACTASPARIASSQAQRDVRMTLPRLARRSASRPIGPI